MPQKKSKTKPEKSKKPAAKAAPSKKGAKSAKAGGLGAVLKKVSKAVGLSGGKKSTPPAKKPAGKTEAVKKAAPAPAKGKKAAPVASPAKGKKEATKPTKAAAPSKPEGKNGKKAEVVVVVPAPKGVALLTKEGKSKKASKAAAELSAKAKRCREPGCDHDFTILGYCRLHYIKNWRRIKRKEAILASGQLNNYVEELVNKYPDKYLDVIRQDLATEKEWGKVVVDLELEGTDEEAGAEEDIDAAAEGVRAPVGSARGEFDDEGDAF